MSRTVASGTPIRGPLLAGAASWKGFVKDKDLTAPPGSPVLGDRYIIASPATGLWATHEDNIAEWDGAVWLFFVPAGGWTVWVEDETEIYVFNGASWGQESFGLHAATHKGGGGDAIDAATGSVDGLMSAADKTKLDGLIETVNFIIDGAGEVIAVGIKGDYIIDFAGTIVSATLLADQSGSMVVDIWKDTYANFPPDNADSITASAPPTISAATKSQDTTLTGWTKTFAKGDCFRLNVDSCATITRATLSLQVLRS